MMKKVPAKKKARYWKCGKHNGTGNTECCPMCVREFVVSLKYQPWYIEYER